MREITVFLAWQSDHEETKKAIRHGLREVQTALEQRFPDIGLRLDEATRGIPGSPNIAATILTKIRTADVFVGDVTPVVSNGTNHRSAPNPNVMLELGYAVALLGWDRIVLLFNQRHGTLDDLPFDIAGHRVATFTVTGGNAKEDRTAVADALTAPLKEIIRSDPPRPKLDVPVAQVRRDHDVLQVRAAMETLHIQTVENDILKAPALLSYRLLHFWDEFNNVVGSHAFYLFDARLRDLFVAFHEAFRNTAAHDNLYFPNPSCTQFCFNDGKGPRTEAESEIWTSILNSARKVNELLPQILNHIRDNFPEVDLPRASQKAIEEYVAFEQNDIA